MSKHRLERPSRLRRAGARARAASPRPVVLVASAAALATGGTVVGGVLLSEGPASGPTLSASAFDRLLVGTGVRPVVREAGSRTPTLSRAFARASDLSTRAKSDASAAVTSEGRLLQPAAVAQAVAGAHDRVWTTADLNLWTAPGTSADQVGELATGKKVLLTGRSYDGRDEVVVGKHRALWVTHGYTTDQRPADTSATAALSDAPCPDSSVEYRLVPDAVRVYRAVCHAFPQIATYGGWADRGEHASGKAIDIMTTDPTLLVQIADFLQAHAAELNLYDIIRLQHIWTPVRASEGWRLMPDRGSPTANHMDHVHVSTN